MYSWVAVHLIVGYLGYNAYEYNINSTADAAFKAAETAAGTTLSRADFDKTFLTSEFYDQANVKGFKRARLAGYFSTLLGLAGTGIIFLAPSNVFQYLNLGSSVVSAYVLGQSLLAKGWYDSMIDSTDPALDSVEEVDPYFKKSRNYLLLGGFTAFASDAFVFAQLYVFKSGIKPAAEPEALPPTEETQVPTELNIW